ncbi:MAG: hypothetical protein Q3972_05490 [Corynebacterium sp.]|nr:hypothetical protein [Corynebacterium sp.]
MAKHLKPGGNKKLAPWLTALIAVGVIGGGALAAINWPSSQEDSASSTESTSTTTTVSTSSAPPALSSVALPPVASPQPTLVLLDASTNMNDLVDGRSLFTISREAITTAATEANQPVSLWNYSSPLNPGVTKGWRNNTGFLSVSEVTPVLMGLGTGGVPQTREAVLATLSSASAYDTPVTIVVVTTGTQDSIADQDFVDSVRAGLNPKDSLNVVHVGGRESDSSLSSVATNTFNARTADEINSAISRAWGLRT